MIFTVAFLATRSLTFRVVIGSEGEAVTTSLQFFLESLDAACSDMRSEFQNAVSVGVIFPLTDVGGVFFLGFHNEGFISHPLRP